MKSETRNSNFVIRASFGLLVSDIELGDFCAHRAILADGVHDALDMSVRFSLARALT
jgi:hypothetical protein